MPVLTVLLPMSGLIYGPSWPRARRIAMTGSENVNYRTGHYSRIRRRLEAELEQQLHALTVKLAWYLPRLPAAVRDEATELLGWLTAECHPDKWVLRDPRPGKGRGIYLPRAAWTFARAWLEKARALQRLIRLHPSLMLSVMPSLLWRGRRGQKQQGTIETSGPRRTAAGEIERLRVFNRARGIPWEPPGAAEPR